MLTSILEEIIESSREDTDGAWIDALRNLRIAEREPTLPRLVGERELIRDRTRSAVFHVAASESNDGALSAALI